MKRLSTRLLNTKKDNPTNILVFDKDDDDAMDFVTSASNLRSTIFKIERKSRFDVKCGLSTRFGNIDRTCFETHDTNESVDLQRWLEISSQPLQLLMRSLLVS